MYVCVCVCVYFCMKVNEQVYSLFFVWKLQLDFCQPIFLLIETC